MENIRPIRTEDDYDWALAEIETYFDALPEKGTPAADRFDVLSELVAAYEDRHWRIEAPDPIGAIEAWLEFKGMERSSLDALFGSRSRAWEIMHKRRPLSLAMIRKLNEDLAIPAEVLIQPYHLETGKQSVRRQKAAGRREDVA